MKSRFLSLKRQRAPFENPSLALRAQSCLILSRERNRHPRYYPRSRRSALPPFPSRARHGSSWLPRPAPPFLPTGSVLTPPPSGDATPHHGVSPCVRPFAP